MTIGKQYKHTQINNNAENAQERFTIITHYKASSQWTYSCPGAEKDMIALLLLELITPSLACFGGFFGGSGGSRCCPCCWQPSVPRCGGGASVMCGPNGMGGMGGMGGIGELGGMGDLWEVGLAGLEGLDALSALEDLFKGNNRWRYRRFAKIASNPSIDAHPAKASLPPSPSPYPEPLRTGYDSLTGPSRSIEGTSGIGKEGYISPQIEVSAAAIPQATVVQPVYEMPMSIPVQQPSERVVEPIEPIQITYEMTSVGTGLKPTQGNPDHAIMR
ncbi:unnamed protein product [Haemonchus placei]|uniref:Collagen triple helix repeat protein n=1 Tax=Haemonchus placei TaxID=6290 RepID=A0A0N4WGW5_HAEPC|nr:unnamed protein product [Haemonchus placei]